MRLGSVFSGVMLQPTTSCNMDCSYCYLPDRAYSRKMPVSVARAVADAVSLQAGGPVQVIWHGGEPLLCGIEYFESLLAPFTGLEEAGRVIHTVQTNATLIDEDWCRLFSTHRFLVGVSMDGPGDLNKHRRNWAHRDMTHDALSGVQKLKDNGLRFSAIAVIGSDGLGQANDLYDFFCDLGCGTLGIALQETKGVHTADPLPADAVMGFWRDLLGAWYRRPELKVREFEKFFAWVLQSDRLVGLSPDASVDPFPVVAWNGDVSLLSPELSGMRSPVYGDFAIGNVLIDPLLTIIQRGRGRDYVRDFLDGVMDCQRVCKFFSYCRGGQASNKLFELGSTRGTETEYCRNTQQRLVDAALESIETIGRDLRQ